MNWYKISQDIVSKEEIGYNDDWGDHHGEVEVERDRWNYGPKGYPIDRGPMPLPNAYTM